MPLRDQDPPFRRHFVFVAGYDPMDVEGHHRIFQREMARFGTVWQASASCDAHPRRTPTGALWTACASGPGWATETCFEMFAWDDLVRADMRRSRWSHLRGGLRAIADMIATGTILRYFRFSHRYGIFFLLTYFVLFVMLTAAVSAGWVAFAAAPVSTLPALGLGLLAAAIVFLGLMRTLGARVRLKQSLDLAEFSVDFVRGRHPAIETRMAAFAARLQAIAAAGGVDEIVVAGHSLGAMHAVSLLACALENDPDLPQKVPLRLLTVGSTAAKFALHPAGARLRRAAWRVFEAEPIYWVEFQARDDIVSFYKVNPVTLRHAGNANGLLRPFVRQVRIRDMMTPETFSRFRLDIMRLHCQFFLANDRRATYDFYAFIFAPVRFEVLAAEMAGPMAVFGPDGAISATMERGAA
ncbi:hypothetical protein [Aquabacter spiritensis]|uniref:Lipase (Class 3) n=1 Tax=Aquabacter spiritensis TaxID=933073 RepID=A0A4R3M2Z3_9HYPH|nr:hypothetical protein [Aquabacter spiritensis]TCT07584.1 hypothetical protein EDC64_101103 [Aquabacter spiritensis]